MKVVPSTCMLLKVFDFPGEIWLLLLPVYGLTISSRKFFETLSEFFRALGYAHFGGHDTCLFKRCRRLPKASDLPRLSADAVASGLPSRPASAGPLGPTPAVFDSTIPDTPESYPYPTYMDDINYKFSPNVDFQPHTAAGLNPDVVSAVQPDTYNELLCVYVDDVLGATHHSAELVQAFLHRFGAKVSPSLIVPGTRCYSRSLRRDHLRRFHHLPWPYQGKIRQYRGQKR